jgi:MFS family permease
MTVNERRTTLALASIMSVRMLGMFMILPVFTLYAHQLPDVTPLLIGLAIGIYGLTQAIFQIPFGMLSDRFGRKPIILIGLLIFALGSIIAALSTSIIGIIIGRALQGSGAIAAAVLALTADLTREEHRVKAMTVLGMSIGLAFAFALIIGPVLNQWIGVPGLFWLTAFLTLIAMAILYWVVPQPLHSHFHSDAQPALTQFKRVLKNTQLLRLDISILLLHFQLTSLFVVLPIVLSQQLKGVEHWQIYLPVMLVAMAAMIPLILFAERRRHLKLLLVAAVSLLGLSQLGFAYWHHHVVDITLLLLSFFIAFNVLEASLPSLISKIAPVESKGTAMGVYSTAQFLGAFLGGLGGGWLYHHYGIEGIFISCAALTVIWFGLVVTLQSPRYLRSQLLNIGHIDKNKAHQLTQCLTQVPGVAEVVVLLEEGVAYLKVDSHTLDTTALSKCPIMRAFSSGL